MSQIRINILDLNTDEISRKIKSLKADPNLVSLSLCIKRKNISKSGKNATTNEINNAQQRKNQGNKQNSFDTNQEVHESDQQDQWKTLHNGHNSSKQKINSQQNTNLNARQEHDLDMTNDKRITKAKKNYAIGNYDTAISILNEMLEEAQLNIQKSQTEVQGDRQRKIANITFHLANCHYRKKKYERAIQLYSMEIPQQNYKRKAMRKSNLGAIYLHFNKNQQSLRNYTQALKIYSQCGCEDVDLSNTYYNLGNIYLRQSMYEIASKYFQMSIDERKAKSLNAELPLYFSAFKLGLSLKYEQKYEESAKSLFYALSFAERGSGDVLDVLKEIASVYELLQKDNQALNFYEKICDNNKSTDQDKGYAYERAAMIYLNSMRNSEGLKILKIAQQCYERAGNERKVQQIKKRKLSTIIEE